MPATTRRQFLQQATLGSVAAIVMSGPEPLAARQTVDVARWGSRVGLELYTVRDLLTVDYEGTLAKVAEIGYTEVEPTSYNNMPPKEFRAMLDRLKLTMPSTHAPARGSGADLERQLEGFQMMGIKYTEIAAASSEPAIVDPRRPATLPPGAYFNAGSGRVRNAFKETEAFGPYQPPVSAESVKRRAAQLNADAKVASRFDMKLLVHNHTGEFEKLVDSPRTSFDILVEETDPALVTMQLDLGLDLHGRGRSDRTVQGAPRPLRALARQGRVRTEDGESVAGAQRAGKQHGHRARGHRSYRLQAGVRATHRSLA